VYFTGWSVTFVTPSVIFTTNGTDRLLGQPLTLSWQNFADSCTPSGGAPNDGWTPTAFPNPGSYPSFSPSVSAVGTYTYTLTCSSGPISITKNIVITVENNAPYVTLSVSPPSYTLTGTSSDGFTRPGIRTCRHVLPARPHRSVDLTCIRAQPARHCNRDPGHRRLQLLCDLRSLRYQRGGDHIHSGDGKRFGAYATHGISGDQSDNGDRQSGFHSELVVYQRDQLHG